MMEFEVSDMTCGHCVKVVTAAIKNAAPDADVTIDLPKHIVRVTGVNEAAAIEQAIREAGYNPCRNG